MRSIKTVSRKQRKVVGIVRTDALVTGATVRMGERAQRIPKLKIISDLEKQCDVEVIDASKKNQSSVTTCCWWCSLRK